MEFRIKLYLFHFFIDHRKMSLMYIKRHTKTVEDLISNISKRFKIDGEFYLTCNDFYLPHFEDIRVLNEDDVVVVVPEASHFEVVQEKRTTPKVAKKLKKKETPVEDNKNEDLSEHETATAKRQKVVDDGLRMMVDELDIDEVDHKKAGKKKNKKPSIKNILETSQNIVREYTRKRKIDPLPISTRPNIVKSIVVQDDFCNGQDAEVTTDSDTSVDSIKGITTSKSKLEDVTSEIDSEVAKVKRKRKRVRHKRKRVPSTLFPAAVTPVISTVGTPSIHIRFDNNVQKELVEASASIHTEQEEKVPEEVIQLDDYKPRNEVNYELLCKSEIGTFPLMKERIPKADDVIAFKKYKLSEAFTPEISNYIIGRVLSFCSDSQMLFVKILEGHGECKDPEGKLFLQQEDEEPDLGDEKHFVWAELLEPRLLFP